MHVQHVVGRHGRCRAAGVKPGGKDERQGRAATGAAVHLEEREIVTAGEQLDGSGGDGAFADGADGAIRALGSMVQRIHSS